MVRAFESGEIMLRAVRAPRKVGADPALTGSEGGGDAVHSCKKGESHSKWVVVSGWW